MTNFLLPPLVSVLNWLHAETKTVNLAISRGLLKMCLRKSLYTILQNFAWSIPGQVQTDLFKSNIKCVFHKGKDLVSSVLGNGLLHDINNFTKN